jgi:hypothetical protein
MKELHPSKEYPIRSYVPQLIKKTSSVYREMKYKPGFIEQYKAVKKIIQKKKYSTLCDLDGAIKVLNLIEMVIKKAKK